MIDRQTLDSLLEQAYVFIQQGDAEQAIAVGNELLKFKHARGFEIIALAFEQQGRSEDTVAILKEGVAKVPNAWPLWELMGNVYSDLELFQDAHVSYSRALSCPNVDADSVQYNVAILLKRQDKCDEALRLCDTIESPSLAVKVRVLRLAILNSTHRYEDAIRMGSEMIKQRIAAGDIDEDDMPDLARAYSEVGRAYWEGRRDKMGAWERAWKALEWDRGETCALWLVREIINRKSSSSQWMKITIEGRWHFSIEPNQPPPNFVTTYEVVADTLNDALNFARDLEPVEVRSSMQVVGNEEGGPFPDNHQGVYWRSHYGFFG